MSTKLSTIILMLVMAVSVQSRESVTLFLGNIPMSLSWGISAYKYNPTSNLEVNINIDTPKKPNQFMFETHIGAHSIYLQKAYVANEIIKHASIQIKDNVDTTTINLFNITVKEFQQKNGLDETGYPTVYDRFILVAEKIEWHYEGKFFDVVIFGWDFKENKAWLPNETKVEGFKLR